VARIQCHRGVDNRKFGSGARERKEHFFKSIASIYHRGSARFHTFCFLNQKEEEEAEKK
jgi:hypothetical protein